MPSPGIRPVGALIRKTSLLRDRPDSARGQRHWQNAACAFPPRSTFRPNCEEWRQGAWSTRTAPGLRQRRTRSDLLFTMSDNTRLPTEREGRESLFTSGRAGGPFRCTHYAYVSICPQIDTLHSRHARVSRHIHVAEFDRLTSSPSHQSGGARRDRTDDLLRAKQALSQLSYGPSRDSEVQLPL
jgi:hypothetical protein